ncbi:MAG: ABC transporter ATP-binding protein [Deltaproteobacteria bacterium]|nr:ABC transporter ATP-binding protein [Deltaproteobacteria bacterium]
MSDAAAASRRETLTKVNPAFDTEDKILAAASDLIGMVQILRMGSHVYLQLLSALALVVIASVSVMTAARTLGLIVAALVHDGSGAQITGMAVGFLVLEATAVGCQYAGRVLLAHATIAITYKVRSELFAKMRRLPISYFDTQPLGRTITRLTADIEGIENFFTGTLARVLIAVINIVVVLVAMVVTDPGFGLVIVAVCLPALAFSVALRRPVIFWLRTYKRRSAHLNAKLAEYLSGLPVIRIFGLEIWTQQQFDEAAGELLDAGVATLNWNSFIRPVTVFLCSLPTLLVLWYGGHRVLAGAMDLGLLVAFVRYSERFVSPIRVISTEIQNIQEAVVSSERVRRMLTEPEEADVIGVSGALRPVVRGQVNFRDVWMSYRPGKPVLRGLNFMVAAGQKVGLVGATGSGKSSTINLIPRLYPMDSGDIFIDGHPIAAIEPKYLRRQIGYVSQDVIVFGGTMRANLLAAHGAGQISDETILAACRRTGLSDVISNCEGGLDYVLVDGGENLSAGERQLVAFTRMLLRDPAILILDEATANIDERCERLIQSATFELMQGRTSFVIAHRLSTIISCDRIFVFQAGQIVEQGTHDALMQLGGYYSQLASKQLAAVTAAGSGAK